MTLRTLISSLAVASALCACNTSGCLDNASSIPLAGFYSSDGKTVALDSIDLGGVGAPGDSLLIHVGERATTVYLPFRSDFSSTSFFIRPGYKELAKFNISDTITFDYDSTPFFASEECGAMYRYHITRVEWTSNLIERVEVTDSLITNTEAERIKIFFRTQ